MPKIRVDNQEIEAQEGKTVLQACLDNGIYIPNLCYIESMDAPSASCRMCFVEVEGVQQPIMSCTMFVSENMVVKTDTESVRKLQRTALRLLLSVHDVDCKNVLAAKVASKFENKRQKVAKHSLIAVFLVNRTVKPFLLPLMISFFGWTYVLILTLLTVAGSLLVGAVVGFFLDSPTGSQ